VTRAIGEVKKALLYRKLRRTENGKWKIETGK